MLMSATNTRSHSSSSRPVRAKLSWCSCWCSSCCLEAQWQQSAYLLLSMSNPINAKPIKEKEQLWESESLYIYEHSIYWLYEIYVLKISLNSRWITNSHHQFSNIKTEYEIVTKDKQIRQLLSLLLHDSPSWMQNTQHITRINVSLLLSILIKAPQLLYYKTARITSSERWFAFSITLHCVSWCLCICAC